MRTLDAATRSSFWADRVRAKTASAMSVRGTPRSHAEITVHFPVPFWPAVSLVTVRRLMEPLRVPSSPAVKINDPYNFMVQANRLAGQDKGVFGPDLPVSAAEARALLERAFGENGRLAGAVLPEDAATPVTRDAFVTALWVSLEGKLAAKTGAADRIYSDIPEAGRLNAVVAALSRADVLGAIPPTGPFEPGRTVTRGLAADLVVRAMASRP